jgi:hypothetical protein
MERGGFLVKWQNFSLQFDFAAPAGFKGFIEDMLLSVTGAFGSEFLGHAKCIVKTEGKSYFASTTALPPVVDWKPVPAGEVHVRGSVEAVWIFIAWEGHIPSASEIRQLWAESALRHMVEVKEKMCCTDRE